MYRYIFQIQPLDSMWQEPKNDNLLLYGMRADYKRKQQDKNIIPIYKACFNVDKYTPTYGKINQATMRFVYVRSNIASKRISCQQQLGRGTISCLSFHPRKILFKYCIRASIKRMMFCLKTAQNQQKNIDPSLKYGKKTLEICSKSQELDAYHTKKHIDKT